MGVSRVAAACHLDKIAISMRLHEFGPIAPCESMPTDALRANVIASADAAVFAQEFFTRWRDRDMNALPGDRPARDVAAIDGVLPDRQARA
jgi:hypothetical protein